MSVNNYRKCAKCGKTRAEDMTVTYHRFPIPGKTNITKARAWAKYCWPNQDWTSEESLFLLYNSNKVLCGRHFTLTQFYDDHRLKLSKFAVPDSSDVVALLHERDNVFQQNEEQPVNVPRVPLSKIESSQANPAPSTSTLQSSFESLTCLKPAFTKQIAAPQSTQVKPVTASKQPKGVLKALNISKISEMTA